MRRDTSGMKNETALRSGHLAVIRLAGVMALAAGACSSPIDASSTQNACLRMASDTNRFTTVEERVPNLETCAARLEAVRMIEGGAVTGRYNGHYIFVSEAEVTSAQSIDGSRFRVFEPDDREVIQAGIRDLINAEPRSADQRP